MPDLPARNQSPEVEELERKQQELAQLQDQLAERELELTTLRAELSALEHQYLDVVGRRYAELDRIEAEIAEELARRAPASESAQEHAREARERADQSAEPKVDENSTETRLETTTEDFRPSDDLKQLYRKAARMLHPDLTTDPDEKERRHRFMSEVNQAYEKNDEARIRQLLAEWQASPENVDGDGTGADLIRVIRQIAQILQRLAEIADELAGLGESELARLKTRVDEAAQDGRNLLQEMADRVDNEIAAAQTRWEALLQEAPR